jgi:hypothetical protein
MQDVLHPERSAENNQYVSHQQTWKCIANKHVVKFTRMGISSNNDLYLTRNYHDKRNRLFFCQRR